MTVTEVGPMGNMPGLDVMNEATEEGKMLRSIYTPENLSPHGPHRAYWGTEKEDPSLFWCWFDWDSPEHHQRFAKE